MPDLEISRLPALTGTALQAIDPIPLTDLSASETKKITAKDLIQNGIALVDAGSIPGDKVNLVIPAGSIGTAEIANGSITALKMADGSSGIVQAGPLPGGEYVGQLGVNTTDSKFYVWDGGAWHQTKASASINEVVGDLTGSYPQIQTTVVTTGDSASVVAGLPQTTAAAQFLAGPSATAGNVTARPIAGTDLPASTATDKGAVVTGSGLSVDAAGILSITNKVAAETGRSLATWDAHGLVTGGGPITSTDLPPAAAGVKGAIYPGASLRVDPTGELQIDNGVTAGAYPKVTVNTEGLVTSGQNLDAVDIPALDASKITSGTFTTSFLADHSVTALKLADYATAYIQDTKPADTGNTIGQFWLNPLAQQIRMWDGNVWVPIGVGALSEQNLRFCGLFNAADGKITVVTKLGLDSGFKVGDVIPTMTDQLTGAYFVCNTPGNAVGQLPGITFDAGDWIVGISVAVGWERVDTLNSGGGGGGASTLDGLTDVTLATPGAGQVLTYNGVHWVNAVLPSATDAIKGIIEIATQAEVDTGTDATRAVVPSTLKSFVDTAVATGTASNTAPATPSAGQVWVDTSKSPPEMNVWDSAKWVEVGATPANASETVKGIVELATAAETSAGTDNTRAVHPAGLKVELNKKAPLASPALTGTPTAPTAAAGTSTTQLATTAFVGAAVTAGAPDATTTVKGIVQLANAAAITAGTAGRVVDAAQLKAFTPADASETVKGIIELATTAEVDAGTDTVRAVTPKTLADNYLAKDISALPALP